MTPATETAQTDAQEPAREPNKAEQVLGTAFSAFFQDPSTLLAETGNYPLKNLATLFGVEEWQMEAFLGVAGSATGADVLRAISLDGGAGLNPSGMTAATVAAFQAITPNVL